MSRIGQTPLKAIKVVALSILGLVATILQFALDAVKCGVHVLEVAMHCMQPVERDARGGTKRVTSPNLEGHGNVSALVPERVGEIYRPLVRRYYTVTIGRRPGIYINWLYC